MASSKHSQAPSTDGLAIALQHPAITGDLKTFCSLAQTCKSWPAALQQCPTGHLDITLQGSQARLLPPSRLGHHKAHVTQLQCFSEWLPKHPGLVSRLDVLGRQSAHDDCCAAAEPALPVGVQLAAQAHAATAGAAPQLRLRSVSIRCIHSPELLQALPAAALTQLSVTYSSYCPARCSLNSSGVTARLQQLSNLQQMSLTAAANNNHVNSACLAAVGQLPLLTQLHLSCVAQGSDLLLLPGQLRQLELDIFCSGSSSSSSSSSSRNTAVAVGHLTALQQLKLKVHGDPGRGSSLPASLTGLTVLGRACSGSSSSGGSDMQHVSFVPLQRLQRLELHAAVLQQQQLQELSSVASLTHIDMFYSDMPHASSEAAAWGHLPALKSLSLRQSFLTDDTMLGIMPNGLNEAASLELLQGLAAATSLTSLNWHGRGVEPFQPWCQHLTSLQQLRSLELMNQLPLDSADVLQLAALTNLTALRIWCSAAVDDAAAAGLALRLTNLQPLSLMYVRLSSATALPAIAQLTGLTELTLQSMAGVRHKLSYDELLLLTALTQLQAFETDLCYEHVFQKLWDCESCGWRQQG